MRAPWLVSILLAGCTVGGGGGNGGDDDAPPIDAPPVVDAPPFIEVACGAEIATVSAEGPDTEAYTPEDTIVDVGDVVQFIVDQDHDVNAQPDTDEALFVDFGETRCFQFNEVGTFGFFCSTLGFAGTISVE